MLQNAEVVLSINIAGTQAQRGSYSHMVRVGSDGKEIDSLLTEKKPVFTNCTKTVRLSNEFVKDCLINVPPELEERISQKRWHTFSEEKRVGMAVHSYVGSISPNYRNYVYELLR